MKIENQKEAEELKDAIITEGEEIRKSLLDKLFSLNAILSAAFLLLYQIDVESSQIGFFNILPFFTVALILIYQYIELLILGKAYYRIDNWKKGDYEKIINSRKSSFNVILLSIILTIVELVYLFYTFLK